MHKASMAGFSSVDIISITHYSINNMEYLETVELQKKKHKIVKRYIESNTYKKRRSIIFW